MVNNRAKTATKIVNFKKVRLFGLFWLWYNKARIKQIKDNNIAIIFIKIPDLKKLKS